MASAGESDGSRRLTGSYSRRQVLYLDTNRCVECRCPRQTVVRGTSLQVGHVLIPYIRQLGFGACGGG